MITVPTTLVLGAGASKPYGFPSGHELRQFLCNQTALNGMYPFGFDQRDLEVFSTTFLKSGMSSIDAFLARRGEHKIGSLTNATYADIGKAAIAYCLIQRERADLLHMASDDHWYQYLWSFMSDSLDSFGENKLRIITFNYDRSLEYYLLTALQYSFGISVQEAALHLQKIPILHVYGQLGVLPDLPINGETRQYHPDVSDSVYIKVAARGIRVIDESRDDDEVFEKAYSYLTEAERICFLGFGFDPTNVRRLRINQLMQDFRMREEDNEPRIFATTFGLEAAERQKIMNRLNPTKSFANPTPANIEPHAKLLATQYLRATGVFIT